MSAWVFLHGFTGHPSLFDPLIEEAGIASARVHRPFLLGHGPAPELRPKGFEEEVDRLARDVATKTEAPRHLLGYSLGGRLGLGLLVRHPGLFHTATLVGVHPGLGDASERARRWSVDAERAAMLRSEGLEAFLAHWEALPMWRTQARASIDRRRAMARVRRSHRAEGLAASLERCGLAAMPCYRDRLNRLSVPISLVVGEEDAKFLSIARAMLPALPRGQLSVVPRAGHNVVLERPGALAHHLSNETAPLFDRS